MGADEFDAGVLEFAGFRRFEVRKSEDEEIVVSGLDDAGFGREAKAGIKNHAKKFAAAGKAAAVGEQGIIGKDSADAGEESVARVAHALNFGAGFFGSNPLAAGGFLLGFLRGFLRRKRELAIEGEGGFQSDEGAAGANPGGEAFVELLSGGFANAGEDFDASGAQPLKAAA